MADEADAGLAKTLREAPLAELEQLCSLPPVELARESASAVLAQWPEIAKRIEEEPAFGAFIGRLMQTPLGGALRQRMFAFTLDERWPVLHRLVTISRVEAAAPSDEVLASDDAGRIARCADEGIRQVLVPAKVRAMELQRELDGIDRQLRDEGAAPRIELVERAHGLARRHAEQLAHLTEIKRAVGGARRLADALARQQHPKPCLSIRRGTTPDSARDALEASMAAPWAAAREAELADADPAAWASASDALREVLRTQREDGGWGTAKATADALVMLVAEGSTHRIGPWRRHASRALGWLTNALAWSTLPNGWDREVVGTISSALATLAQETSDPADRALADRARAWLGEG